MISIKVTSEYSLLKSLIKIPDLIKFLMKNNINYCPVCDNELFSCMEVYLTCKENNLNPIIGLDVVIDNYHFYIYAKDYEGYQNLLKINTLKNHNLQIKDLEKKGIIIVIPYESIDCYQEFRLKDNLYIGYSTTREKNSALLLSENVIYAPNVRVIKEEDIPYLEYLEQLGGKFFYNDNSYLKINNNEDDKKRTLDFVNLFHLEIPFNQSYIPKYDNKDNSFEYLKSLATKGLAKRLNGNVSDVYQNRLNEELKVINEMGFVDYFLIVYDYVLFAKKNNILVGPGRGSACGSLVSYVIGITDIDPIKYDLLFARFLNPYRKKMPDIDIDFEATKRDEVINYVKNKYGKEKVALGITFNSLKTKLVLRDVAKLIKINNDLLEKFMKNIEGNLSLKENLKKESIQKYLELYPELKKLYDISMHLENLKKNVSTHAAGVVISSTNLDNIIPIYEDENSIRTGITMDYLEKFGLLKMDFLGLKNLTIIDSLIKSVSNFNLKDISLEDSKTFKIFQDGDTDHIFQFESSYARNNLMKLKVNSFNELVIAIALVRPGPNKQIDNYIKNKETNNYEVHPDLKDILDSTKGIIIFQEQVMKILEVIGGFTSYEADNIRLAMSKKKADIINNYRNDFITRAIKKGYDENFVVDLFEKIVRFSEYGFNKSHAVSYALISYQMAYFKANYPNEFSLVLLKEDNSIKNRKNVIEQMKKKGLKVLKPNINVSSIDYQINQGYLLMPLTTIKGITENLAKEIIDLRKNNFNDIYDFMFKCQKIINGKNYNVFVLSGLLDTFKINKKTLMENKDILFNYAELGDENAEKPLLNNFDEYDEKELRSYELEYYDMYIGNHPASIYHDVVKINDILKYLFKNVKMILLVEKITKIKTKNNEDMAFVLASDETGEIELTVFPECFRGIENLELNDVVFVQGKVSKRFDKYQIVVNNIKRK